MHSDVKEPEFESDEQQESDEDLIAPGSPRFEAVLTATDWTIGTIIDQLRRGTIDLNPRFQRRDAWRTKRKSEFIESVIINVPIPQIVLAERRRGSFIVIDGKQRLLTLKQFAGLDDQNNDFNNFRLQSLKMKPELNGITYGQLQEDSLLADELNAFENFTIRSVVIRNWPSEDYLYLVFHRLNTASVPLSPQELRQALHPGGFSEFVDVYSIENKKIRQAIGSDKPDFRMRDAELVIRFFAFNNFLGEYKGNLKPLLDRTTEFFNNTWETQEANVLAQARDLERSIDTSIRIFGDENVFRKWNGDSFERALNRAVFDVMALFFCRSEIADSAIARSNAVAEAFKNLCVTNERFRDAIEGTTKSKASITTRLEAWGDTLQAVGVPADLISERLRKLSVRD